MLSVRFGLLIFLATVRTTEYSPLKHNCNWSCEIVHDHDSMNVSGRHRALQWKTVFLKTGQIKAKFRLNKRVEQDCVRFLNIANTSESIEVWIAVQEDSSDVSLLTFAQINVFNNLWSLSRWILFGSNSLEHEVNSISCVFSLRSSQKSNKSNGLVGLEEIYSPYFYLKQVANFSQERPLIGYIFTNDASKVVVGFNKPEEANHSFMKAIIIISWMVWIYFALYGLSFFLRNFQSNISTVEIPETPTSAIHPENQTEQGKNFSETARVHDPPPDWVGNGGVQGALSDLPGEGALGRVVHTPSVSSEVKPAQAVEQVDSVKTENVPELTHVATPFQENGVSGHTKSELVFGRDRLNTERRSITRNSTCRVEISENSHPDPDSMVQSDGPVKQQSSPFRSSSENTDTFNQGKQIQAHLRDNRKRKSVRVMHFQGNFSSHSLASFIVNTFLKSEYVKYVNLLLFISAKVFPMLVLDIFLLPGVLLKSTPSVTSTYFTKSVLLSAYKRCPEMLVCFVFYVFRCVCLCFYKSPQTWAPGFVIRKHFLCFVKGCYVTKLLARNCDFSACSECKEQTPDCPQEIDIPGNILCNDLGFDQIVMKVWKDVVRHLLPVLLQAPKDTTESASLSNNENNSNNNESDLNSNTTGLRNFTLRIKHCLKFILKPFCYIVVFFLFILLIILDLALSSPTVSFCFPRVWFTVHWFENNRVKQFLCLLVEFICICCSIAWGVYLLFCCAVSFGVVFASLLMTSVKYGLETFLTYCIIVLFWHNLLGYYRSFLDKYNNLNSMLHKVCTEDHQEQLKQYQKGDEKVYFPENLVVSVHKLIPFRESAKALIENITCCAVMQILFLLMLQLIERPTIEVLPVAFTLLLVVPLSLKYIFFDRGKLEDLNNLGLEENVKKHVQEYFKQKRE